MLFKKEKKVKEEGNKIEDSTANLIEEIARSEAIKVCSAKVVPYVKLCIENELRNYFPNIEATLEERILVRVIKKALIEIKEGEK